MPYKIKDKYLKLGTPAIYRIEVEGPLDESWSDRLAGMCINPQKNGSINGNDSDWKSDGSG